MQYSNGSSQFNVATPGRLEDSLESDDKPVVETRDSLKQDSVRIIEALGGQENIRRRECLYHSFVSVKDVEKVNKKQR